jgi:hypothetical protein
MLCLLLIYLRIPPQQAKQYFYWQILHIYFKIGKSLPQLELVSFFDGIFQELLNFFNKAPKGEAAPHLHFSSKKAIII